MSSEPDDDIMPSNVAWLTGLVLDQYLLGYMHGRPDAYLTEMQKILKEAFDIDVSLPTISRTLKMKGCTKGFNKTRHIRTATKAPVQDQMNGSHPDGSSSQPSPEKHNPGQGVDVAPIMAFEKNLERHLEQHFEQNPTNGVALNGTALGPAMGVPVHQYQPKKSTQSQTHCPEHDISLSVAPANSTQTNTNGAIDPALG